MVESKNQIQKIRDYDWKKLFFELIVVFLGVTAGFLLNNWQLEKQDELLDKKYMNGFLQDVNTNITELKTAIESDSLWLNRANDHFMPGYAGFMKATGKDVWSRGGS